MRILIFGDSNTWGYDAHDGSRQPDRFTRLIQRHHPEWTIIEEGMNGRLLSSRDPRCFEAGDRQIEAAIARSYPLDLAVIALGANDARRMNAQTTDEWKRHLDVFLSALQNAQKRYGPFQILLVSPPLISSHAEYPDEVRFVFGESGQKIIQQSQKIIRQAALEHDWLSLISSDIGLEGAPFDGIHFETFQHQRMASALEEKIVQAEHEGKFSHN